MQKHYAYFSAAIRDGARLTPRGMTYLLLDRQGGTCALGAGAVALGLPTETGDGWVFLPDERTNRKLLEMFPYLGTKVRCPADGNFHDLRNIIADLFDVEGWTREAIADWLYAEEEKLGFVTLIETTQVSESVASTAEITTVESLGPASQPEFVTVQ